MLCVEVQLKDKCGNSSKRMYSQKKMKNTKTKTKKIQRKSCTRFKKIMQF